MMERPCSHWARMVVKLRKSLWYNQSSPLPSPLDRGEAVTLDCEQDLYFLTANRIDTPYLFPFMSYKGNCSAPARGGGGGEEIMRNNEKK